MPPKKSVPQGELTAPELRKLIKAHNILSKITIPKGTDREGLIKLIEGKNYEIDHKNKVIKPKVKRGKQISLKQAEELTKPKPVSEAVKKQRAEKKKEKEEEKKKEIKIAKKEAVQEFKKKQKEAKKKIKKSEKLNAVNDLKIKSISNNKKDMGETAFIKQQKKLQLQKQKETRRALLKSKPPVDKTTRRGKPVKKEEPKKEEPKKEEASFKGIKLNGSQDIFFKDEVDILDYVDKKYDTKGFKDPQITKLEKLFKLVEENPKYLTSLGISTSRGADPSPFDEGNIYIIPYYMESGTNEVPANKKPFKYIKLKGEPKKVVNKKSEALKQKKKSRLEELMKKFNFKYIGEAVKTIEEKKYPELYKKLRPLEKEQNEIIKEIRSGKSSLKEKAPLMEKEKQIKKKINEIKAEIRKAKPNKITKEEQELLDLILKINMN